jgi:hypothetical protein
MSWSRAKRSGRPSARLSTEEDVGKQTTSIKVTPQWSECQCVRPLVRPRGAVSTSTCISRSHVSWLRKATPPQCSAISVPTSIACVTPRARTRPTCESHKHNATVHSSQYACMHAETHTPIRVQLELFDPIKLD